MQGKIRQLIAALAAVLIGSTAVFAAAPYVLVLGVGQDAGVPQMGCESPFCRRAWANESLRQTVSSIALVDPDSGRRWIFDATPDLPAQFELLKAATRDRRNNIDGIFLTHAHIGHYTGLMYLGRESMNTSGVKVYAMPRMAGMLAQNSPWSQLVLLKNINLETIAAKVAIPLGGALVVEPFLVPHRDEFSETVGYRISSRDRTLIYIPDIDKWEKFDVPLSSIVHSSDFLIIDGTFYADGEIARPMSEVPHPFVTETMKLLGTLPRKERAKVHFIHFNHSNPLVQGDKAALREVRRRGFLLAKAGRKFTL